MKSVRGIGVLVAAVALAGTALAAPEGNASRLGLGVNLNRLDVRYELDALSAVGGYFGVDTANKDLGTVVEFGGYYLKRLKAAEPASLHLLGGLSYGTDNTGGEGTLSSIIGAVWGGGRGVAGDAVKRLTFFAGAGAEYFLPGTRSLSVEGDVGLIVQIISDGETATRVAVGNLAGGLFMLRYYLD